MFRFLAFGLAVCPSVARATTMIMMDVEQQAEESHALVTAVVGGSTVVVTERMVYTDTRLWVSDVLGGEAPKALILRQAGGVLPERTVYLPGDARLAEGDHIAAFVRERDGRWFLTALGQSVWQVDAESGLSQDLDAHLMERDSTGKVVPSTTSPMFYDTLGALERATASLRFGGAL